MQGGNRKPAPDLLCLLEKHRVKKGDNAQRYTHFSMGAPAGRFYVPASDHDQLMDAYVAFLSAAATPLPSMVEAHRHVGPIVVDIDLRQAASGHRLYTDDDVAAFVSALYGELAKLVDLDHVPGADRRCFVLEKPAPRTCGKHSILAKDGFHVHLPGVITRPEIQVLLRRAMLPHVRRAFCFGGDGRYVNAAEDMYDEAVIRRAGWIMYGAKKPDEQWPWRVTRVYTAENVLEWTSAAAAADADDIDEYAPVSDLARLLSIRRYEDHAPLTQHGTAELEAELEAAERAKARREAAAAASALAPFSAFSADEPGLASLVALLSPARAAHYETWLKVGFGLHNVTSASDVGLHLWMSFASQCPAKFDVGEHEREWRGFGAPKREDESGVRIGSLRMWAKEDSPDGFRAWEASQRTAAIAAPPLSMNINTHAFAEALKTVMPPDVVGFESEDVRLECVPEGVRFACGAVGGLVRRENYAVDLDDGRKFGPLFSSFDVPESVAFLHKNIAKEALFGCTIRSEKHATLQGKPPHQGSSIELLNMDTDATRYAAISVPDRSASIVKAQGSIAQLAGALARGMHQQAERQFGITNNLFLNLTVNGNNNNVIVAAGVSLVRSDEVLVELMMAEHPDAISRIRFCPDTKTANCSGIFYCDPASNVWRRRHNAVLENVLVGLFGRIGGDKISAAELKRVQGRRGRADMLHVLAGKSEDMGFSDRLDANLDVFAVDNGLFDSSSSGEGPPVFRKITPQDMVGRTAGWSYDVAEAGEHRGAVEAFLAQVLPVPEERDVALAFFAGLLSGRRLAKKFLVLTDKSGGDNGKSTLMVLFKLFFGGFADASGAKYVCKGSFDRGKNDHDAGVELMRAVRLLIAEELKNTNRLDDGDLKAKSGGDETTAEGRSCGVGEGFRFVWQAGIVLVFNEGDCPQFDAGDRSFMKRMLIVPMRSKFVTCQPSAVPTDYEFPVSDSVKHRFPAMRSALADVLLEHFRSGMTSAFFADDRLPPAMREWRQSITSSVNPLAEWLERITEVTGNEADYVLWTDLKSRYAPPAGTAALSDASLKRYVTSFFSDEGRVVYKKTAQLRLPGVQGRKPVRDIFRGVRLK